MDLCWRNDLIPAFRCTVFRSFGFTLFPLPNGAHALTQCWRLKVFAVDSDLYVVALPIAVFRETHINAYLAIGKHFAQFGQRGFRAILLDAHLEPLIADAILNADESLSSP